jgi:RNA polymerase-binding protein DksA
MTMSAYTESQKKRLQTLLEARAEQLRAEIRQGRKLDNHYKETDDDAVADLEAGIDIAAVERDSVEMHAVEAALARIGTPAYGACTDCRIDIAFERLLANPSATRCADCQTRHEAGRRGPTL